MIRPPKRLAPLLTLSAALAAVVALELAAGPFFVPDAPQGRAPADTLGDSPTDLPAENQPQSAFSEIVARPLFSPSRRPPAAQPESKVVADDTKSETFDLIGVIISADSRMALLRTQDTSEVVRAIEGQSVAGWQVRAINPTEVVLERGGDSETLKISNVVENPAAGSNPGVPGVNAGAPGVNGGGPGVNPGAPGENPEAPGDNSGMTGANPGVTGANPRAPGANPGVIGANPGAPGAIPGLPDDSAGAPGGSPGGPSGLPAATGVAGETGEANGSTQKSPAAETPAGE